ncbi:MAG: response regulator [Euryarchaeota archaeon]|nr:response regulator [Euryarchaeota archaeon]
MEDSGEDDEAARNRVVLVVDDEHDIVEGLATILPRWIDRVEVLKASSGEEGLEIARGRSIDLIITDYRMPGMNGLEFLERARDADLDTATILITAFPNVPEVLEAVETERIGRMFTKPFQVPELIEAVVRDLSDGPAWVD